MSFPKSSFDRASLQNISIDASEICKKEPHYYSNSSTKLDYGDIEVEIIKDKYQREYSKFSKNFHQRSKSQIAKIDRIIQDANDLNEILNDHNKWLLKKSIGL